MLSFDSIWLILALIFTAISVYTFVSSLLSISNEDKDSMAWATGDEPTKSKSPLINFSRPLVHNFTIKHARKFKNKKRRDKIEKRILTSGLTKELNVDEYIGLQILWGIFFPIALVVMNFALSLNYPYWASIGIGFFGVMVPKLHTTSTSQARYRAVVTDLPFFIDLLALSTEAGLDFINSIQRITEKAESSVLADEFGLVLHDIQLGSSRAEALRALASRLDIPEITSFTGVIIDADQTGTSISKVLKDQSEQIRLERFVRAEKAGAKASQVMLIPMMLFIVPAVFIMVFAPVIVQFFYEG